MRTNVLMLDNAEMGNIVPKWDSCVLMLDMS